MLQLIRFFTNNRVFLLFILLEFIAFSFVIRSHSFHHSKFVNSANALSGGILKRSNTITSYFKLSQQNKSLVKDNELLKNQIEKIKNNPLFLKTDSTSKYQHIAARIVSNPYHKRNNILTIDKGTDDGVEPNMGVVLTNGIVGITLKSSKNYSTVLSLLNGQTKINAKMVNSHHYGSLEWNGENFKEVQFVDLPIQANIKKGDTIISGGKSVIFPESIPIGVVKDFSIEDKAYSNISIELFSDMSALNFVYVIKNKQAKEQFQLEKESINE